MRILILGAALAALLFGASWLAPSKAECLGCVWVGSCYSNSICGDRCVCVKQDSLDISGICIPARA